MATKKRPAKKLDTLLQAMNLRQTVVIEHQNELFDRVEKLEAGEQQRNARIALIEKRQDVQANRISELELAKQSPSERYLFAKFRDFEAHLRRLEQMQQPRPEPKSARELHLERENEWLRQELRRYTRQ